MKSFHLPLLIISFVMLGAVYAVVTPLFEASDELWHYPFVQHLAQGGGLPVQNPVDPGPWRQEASQPPLYYVLMAAATFWIDSSDLEQVRWLNPHADNGIITPDGNNNIVIHTYREKWPWRGAVLAVRLIRLLSVALGAVTVYFTYRLALELMPRRHYLALAAAGCAAFTPMFIFISASVNNDNLAICLAAAVVWLLAHWLRNPPVHVGRQHYALGILLGAAALSKESALGLFPLAVLVVTYGYFRANACRRGMEARDVVRWWGHLILHWAVILVPAALIAGWWYGRNLMLYDDWLGWNAFIATVGRRPRPASLAQLWGERTGFVQAYWGLFGGVSVPMPDWMYVVFNFLAVLALAGGLWGVVETTRSRRWSIQTLILWGLPVGWIALICAGLVRWTSLTWASQGRLIFPAISAVSVILAAGWGRAGEVVMRLAERLFGPPTGAGGGRQGEVLALTAAGGMAALAAIVPFAVIGPHYAPPPELTPVQMAAIAHPRQVDFGGEMELLGYNLETPAVMPGETVRLTLYWRTLIPMDRNWSVFLHVVDDQGLVVAQRDRYPGAGALATTLLPPGRTWADYYVIAIPAGVYTPAAARLEVGLYDVHTGERLPAASGGEAVVLAPLEIRARPGDIPNALRANFANRVELVGYALDRRTAAPGEPLTMTFYWQALAPLSVNYSVFVHVRGEGETLWGGHDGWPQDGAAPTSLWRVGEIITDTHTFEIDAATPLGTYDLEAGVYDAATLERLQFIAADGRITDADFIYLSRILVR